MRFLKFWILFMLFPMVSYAGNWYVSKAASGTGAGTSWTNAWKDFNNISFSSVSCGDTIWIAGGTPYTGSMSIAKNCTSGSPLLIRRVLSSDTVPVSAPGWNPSFDSQVVNNNGTITWSSGAYVTVDGRVGDAHSGVAYGIQYLYTGNGVWAVTNTSTAISNMTLTHVELYGPVCATAGTCTGSVWGVNLGQGGASTDSNIMVDHSWVHRFAEVLRAGQQVNFVVQYSYIGEDERVTPADHEDLIYAASPVQLVLINNYWYDSGNDGVFCDYAGCDVTAINNVFYSNGGWHMSYGKTGTCGPVKIWNNIFEADGNSRVEYPYGWIGTGGCTVAGTSDIANNIFYESSPDASSSGPGIGSYTRYSMSTSDFPFDPGGTSNSTYTKGSPLCSFNGWTTMCPSASPPANLVTADFHLTSAGKTLFGGKGVNLTSKCSTYPSLCTDLDGNARPATGAWDIGPYNASTVLTYSLSGTVTGASAALLTLSGAGSGTTTGGAYSFSSLPAGSYVVTPSLYGYTFSPTSLPETITSSNITGVNFTATPVPTYSISGTVTGTSGATLTLSGAASGSTTGGSYSFTGLAPGSYFVTPSLSGYTFSPVNASETITSSNISAVNFVATAIPPTGLAIDASVNEQQNSATSSVTSPAFSTVANGETLLAFIGADAHNPGQKVTSVTGGSLTWTLVRRTNTEMGDAEVWTARAPSTLSSATVTANLSQSATSQLSVISFTGSAGISASGSGAASPGAPTAKLTTTKAGSWIFGVGNDWDNAIARTVGPNQTILYQDLSSSGDTYWVQSQNNVTASSCSVVTINDTAPTTDRFNMTVVEVLAQ